LRLKWTCGLSHRAIARSCRISHSTVSEYLVAYEHGEFNLAQVQELSRTGCTRLSLPQFDVQEVERVIEHALELDQAPAEGELERLINLCDRALIVTLADTGLRIHAACALRRGQIDWASTRGAPFPAHLPRRQAQHYPGPLPHGNHLQVPRLAARSRAGLRPVFGDETLLSRRSCEKC
jgi:hypothetical protein